jgi:DeoR/GlpR family transcriptional regulator of sugar metabolism
MNIKEHRGARVNSENCSAEILKEIEARGSVSVVDLAKRFAVSEMTVRCELRDLEKAALALEDGAHAVVVGTAITRPGIIAG